MQLKHIREKGFHMVNHILTALSENYLRDLFPQDEAAGQTEDKATQAVIASSGEK